MPPTTLSKPKITPAGMNARNSIAEVRQNVNLGATPQQARATLGQIKAGPATPMPVAGPTVNKSTGFTVPLPDTVPAEALNGNIGRTDVRGMRDTMEQNNLATEQFNTDYGNLMGRVQAPLQTTPFQNPQAFIEQTLLRRSTDTQNTLDQTRQGQADTLRGMGNELDTTRQNAVEQFALPELQQNLADTRNRIAERTNLLRTTIRDFETNAERRGVARQFVESEKQKVQADAASELADLAIIESAQAGNVAMAQEDIDRAVNAKLQSFEFENQAIQTEIKRLEAMDTRESQARSEQLQIALTERTRNIEQAVADEKQKLTYLSEAARNGADQGTLDAIRKATNVGEAAMMAGPFIGRLDRQQAEANLANTYSQISSRNLNDTISLAEKGDANAISELGFDPRKTTGNFEAESGLRKEFNALPTVKEAVSVQQSYAQIKAANDEAIRAAQTGESSSAADQALIISFNKMLDPTSVVREGEFARSTQGQSYLQQLQAKVDQAMRGGAGLSPETRQALVNTTQVLYGDYIKNHNDEAYSFRQNAVRQGGDPSYVAGYLDTTVDPKTAQEGDIIVINGEPLQKTGDKFIKLDI